MSRTIESRLADHAEKIRELGKRALRDVIEIGRLLTEAKMLAGTGNGCRGCIANLDGPK
jgi:hypothetical protein